MKTKNFQMIALTILGLLSSCASVSAPPLLLPQNATNQQIDSIIILTKSIDLKLRSRPEIERFQKIMLDYKRSYNGKSPIDGKVMVYINSQPTTYTISAHYISKKMWVYEYDKDLLHEIKGIHNNDTEKRNDSSAIGKQQ